VEEDEATAGGELLAHLTASVALVRDLECQADLLLDPELLRRVRGQANAVTAMLHRIGAQVVGRRRGA
jgi:hypothetical protein